MLGAEHLNYYDVFFFYLCTVHFYNVKILLPTNAPFIKRINTKIYIKPPLYSHSYMFLSVQTIIRESILSLAKVTFFCRLLTYSMEQSPS